MLFSAAAAFEKTTPRGVEDGAGRRGRRSVGQLTTFVGPSCLTVCTPVEVPFF